MIRVKMLKNNEVCIIDGNKSYLFNSSGRCYMEDAGLTPEYMNGMILLPVLSVLSCNSKVDIFVYENDNNIRHFEADSEGSAIAMGVMYNKGYIRMLTRSGRVGSNDFNQILFIYPVTVSAVIGLQNIAVREYKEE